MHESRISQGFFASAKIFGRKFSAAKVFDALDKKIAASRGALIAFNAGVNPSLRRESIFFHRVVVHRLECTSARALHRSRHHSLEGSMAKKAKAKKKTAKKAKRKTKR
jgi:hypothetical protein